MLYQYQDADKDLARIKPTDVISAQSIYADPF